MVDFDDGCKTIEDDLGFLVQLVVERHLLFVQG